MTLAHEVSDGLASSLAQRIQPTFGYYRQPNGWVKYAPVTRLERLRYEEQGWKCLAEYGFFDVTAYSGNHPLEGLFMFGGAKELPVEQILQMGLYIDPPLVPRCKQHLTQFHRSHRAECWRGAAKVEFPQMADVKPELIGPFVCDFCQRKMPTAAARAQHQSVAHTKPLGDIQTGTSLGRAVAEAMGKTAPAPDREQLLKRIAELEATTAQPVRAPFPAGKARVTCECGRSHKKGGETLHRRGPAHQEWAKKEAQPA